MSDRKKYMQEYMQSTEYKESNKARMKETYYTEEGQAYEQKRRRYPQARFRRGMNNAKKRGKDWTLTLEQYLEVLGIGRCYYCNTPSVQEETGHSLDRIDDSQGYHMDNVRLCCKSCNRSRHKSMGSEEFRKQNKLNGRWFK